jgi:hypothetical protein
MNIIQKTVLASFSAAALFLSAQSAHADLCKSPKVKVVNDRPVSIQVTKFSYYDGCDKKWRDENVAETAIAPGGNHIFTDDLEYAGNCPIPKFKLFRALHAGKNSTSNDAWGPYNWGSEHEPDEGNNVKCNTNVNFTIHAAK